MGTVLILIGWALTAGKLVYVLFERCPSEAVWHQKYQDVRREGYREGRTDERRLTDPTAPPYREEIGVIIPPEFHPNYLQGWADARTEGYYEGRAEEQNRQAAEQRQEEEKTPDP